MAALKIKPVPKATGSHEKRCSTKKPYLKTFMRRSASQSKCTTGRLLHYPALSAAPSSFPFPPHHFPGVARRPAPSPRRPRRPGPPRAALARTRSPRRVDVACDPVTRPGKFVMLANSPVTPANGSRSVGPRSRSGGRPRRIWRIPIRLDPLNDSLLTHIYRTCAV